MRWRSTRLSLIRPAAAGSCWRRASSPPRLPPPAPTTSCSCSRRPHPLRRRCPLRCPGCRGCTRPAGFARTGPGCSSRGSPHALSGPGPATAAAPPAAEPEADPAAAHASGFPFVYPETWSEAARFADLPGWAEDRQDLALKAFRISCRTILAASGPPRTAPRVWQAVREICPRAMALPDPVPAAEARAFFEREFRPVRIARFGERIEADGFLTGYYEPEVLASRERTDAFPAPFHAKPTTSSRRAAAAASTPARGPGAGSTAASCPISTAARSRRARSPAGAWRSPMRAIRST